LIKYIQQTIAAFLGYKQNENYFSDYIIKNSIQLFLLHCFSLAIGFLSNYVLIKTAGVNDYGSYIYIFNFLYMIAGFCILGMDTLLIKKVSVYDAAGNYRELKGIIFFAIGVCFLSSLIVAGISRKIANITGVTENSGGVNWFILSFSTLLMLSVITINQASLQGLKKITLSQVGEKIARPIMIIAFVIVLFSFRKKITLDELIWINIVALGITLLFTSILHKKNIGSKLKNVKPEYEFINWTNSAIAFFLLGALYILNSRVDVFLLGLLRGNDEVGVYNIVLKISEIISFGLVIINFIIAPVIAKLFTKGELPQLQGLVTQSARLVLMIGLPLLLIIIFFRKSILVFFGVNFFNSQEALLILCLGQLINILSGSVGMLLLMSGYQRFSIYSLAISTAFNIMFNIILTPKYGIVGTAIATAASIGMWNCLMYLFVRKKINIRPTAFGIV
jgi:O-antigen/teichoic acid export membrane protein